MTSTTARHPAYVAGTWVLDPAHSSITFSVRHLAISEIRGRFEKFDVTVRTGEDPRDSTITASIDVASVNTGQQDRDNHLRTSDFFLVAEFPTLRFASTSITPRGDLFTMAGDLTLRGVTRPVVLTGEFGGIAVDDSGQTKAGATASTVINRLDYGVNWNAKIEAGGFTLADEVKINIDVQVILQ